MNLAVAVFAKTPGLTPLKTRLGADIGRPHAENIYQHCRDATAELLTHCGHETRVDVIWAVAEAQAAEHPFWHNHRVIWTGLGNLGQRLQQVFETLRNDYDAVILMGSDSPGIHPHWVAQAVNHLQHTNPSAIIGPCRDGGFYLLGVQQAHIGPVLSQVTYSQTDTRQQLEQQLQQAGLATTHLPTYFDIDTLDDCHALRDDLAQRTTRPAALNALYTHLQQLTV